MTQMTKQADGQKNIKSSLTDESALNSKDESVMIKVAPTDSESS